MAVQVYTFKVTYEGCDNKIHRTFEVSSNYDLARLGYMILASFDTMAYHLFSIEHRGVEYQTAIENYGKYPLLQDAKLAKMELQIGEHLHMIYDFGTEQHFDIELTCISDMPKGSGRAYPKVIAGAGRGIIDDMAAYELMEIIEATDKNGKSDYIITTEYGNEMIWDYRDYSMEYDNCLLKVLIDEIKNGYECGE